MSDRQNARFASSMALRTPVVSNLSHKNMYMSQCRWCSSNVLEISLESRLDESGEGHSTRGSIGPDDQKHNSNGDVYACDHDLSIESVISDRFKGSSCAKGHALLEMCSNIIGLPQPICKDCARDIEQELVSDIEHWSHEGLAYEKLLLQSTRPRKKTSAGNHGILPRAESYEIQCNVLEEELKGLEKAKMIQESIEGIEREYWESFNTLNLQLHEAANLRDALQMQMDYSNNCMETLMPTSKHIMLDMFCISENESLGTISGFRLGSTGGIPVEWWEINTAWGQAVLLLDMVRDFLAIQFDSGRIVLDPCGSYSRILERGKGYHDLYGPVHKFLCAGFDKAQVLFLQCIQQVEKELQGRAATYSFELPYAIEGDKVGGCSIRYSFCRDKVWSEALQNMLLNLKECLLGTLAFQGARDMTSSHSIAEKSQSVRLK